jgi:hypothetical protein
LCYIAPPDHSLVASSDDIVSGDDYHECRYPDTRSVNAGQEL